MIPDGSLGIACGVIVAKSGFRASDKGGIAEDDRGLLRARNEGLQNCAKAVGGGGSLRTKLASEDLWKVVSRAIAAMETTSKIESATTVIPNFPDVSRASLWSPLDEALA